MVVLLMGAHGVFGRRIASALVSRVGKAKMVFKKRKKTTNLLEITMFQSWIDDDALERCSACVVGGAS